MLRGFGCGPAGPDSDFPDLKDCLGVVAHPRARGRFRRDGGRREIRNARV